MHFSYHSRNHLIARETRAAGLSTGADSASPILDAVKNLTPLTTCLMACGDGAQPLSPSFSTLRHASRLRKREKDALLTRGSETPLYRWRHYGSECAG